MADFKSKIVEIKDETPDVKTFVLKKPWGFSFIPGQYCLVSIVDNEKLKDAKKPLTFSNSPTSGHLELTAKKMGDFTSELFNLEKGDKLHINGPLGDTFNFHKAIERPIVYLAGGTGVTPFMSAIRFVVAKKLKHDLTLIYGNLSPKDIIFRKELEEINEKHANINIVFAVMQDKTGVWKGHRGFINKTIVQDNAAAPGETLFMMCGPPPMMKAMKRILQEMKTPDPNIIIDKWEMPGKSENPIFNN